MRNSPIYYQRSSTGLALEESTNNSHNSNSNSSNQKENFNNEENYNEYTYNQRGMFLAFPFFAIMTHKLNQVSCFFSSNKPETNKMTNRVALIQYPSNNPIEDRWAVHQLEAISGYVTMVFDGHGGWQVADYAKENLPKEIDNALKRNKEKSFASEEEYITQSIKDAFDVVENNFLAIAKEAYRVGFPDTGKVGACALVALVHDNKVYAANAGDCQGVVVKNEKGQVSIRKINRKLNANSKKERARLRAEFTDDDIVVCKRGDEKACYVKNRLQPTRAFGDFRLKHPEFNNPQDRDINHGYRMKIDNFKGPYISHVPEIQVIEVDRNDKYLILSSDGMWDELTKQDVAKIAEKNLNDKQKLTTDLLNSAIGIAAQKIKISESEIRSIPVGQRRKIHDDMTIVVVDLENQGK